MIDFIGYGDYILDLKVQEKHGLSKKYPREYHCWKDIRQRIFNDKNSNFKNYGGRGIKLSPSWLLFSNFMEDMGEAPLLYEIDRIDVDGNYCKENCRWVIVNVSAINKRPTRKLPIGVHLIGNMYRSVVCINKIQYHLGMYSNIQDALKAREKVLEEWYGFIP